jgi:hypothetical protein
VDKLWRAYKLSDKVYEDYFRCCKEGLRLKDLRLKRPALGKSAYLQRVRRILWSRKAQTVAGKMAGNLRKVCKQVVKKRGAASRC